METLAGPPSANSETTKSPRTPHAPAAVSPSMATDHLADADGPVEDDGLSCGQPAQRGEVADLGGGQFGGGGEVESFQGGGGLEAGAADPAGQGHGCAAGDLVLA